jgi:hypothetical protein
MPVDNEMLIEPEMKAAPCGDFLIGLPDRASDLSHTAPRIIEPLHS